MKVIIDTNLWISFLLGHQTQIVRRMLTDLRIAKYHFEIGAGDVDFDWV